ncbi:MAG: PorT family protein [Chitinophagaceae bacterium]|nr:MAG: PorT family protein [Chitinophagaceae bacterium]
MKKILSFVAAVMVASSLNAQTLSLGPTAGFGHSWLRFPDADDANPDRGFHPSYNAGVKVVYSFVSHWGVSADVKFSSEGVTFKDADSDDKQINRLNYLRVPLQGIYFFEQLGDRVRPKVSLGPSFGFLLGANSRTKVDGELSDKQDIKDNLETFDLGATLGVGANIRISRDIWLNTDISYLHGFTGISKGDISSGDDLKNSGLTLNVGVLFPIGKGSKK